MKKTVWIQFQREALRQEEVDVPNDFDSWSQEDKIKHLSYLEGDCAPDEFSNPSIVSVADDPENFATKRFMVITVARDRGVDIDTSIVEADTPRKALLEDLDEEQDFFDEVSIHDDSETKLTCEDEDGTVHSVIEIP